MQPIGVWKRAVAVLIDSILLGVVGYVIAAVTGSTTATGFDLAGGPFFLLVAIGLAYYVVMEATRGATLGKIAMKLKVVKEADGAAIDWQASIVRNALRLIDGLFLYLVGAIVVWVSKKRQRLGDMAAGTIVVSARLALLLACALFVTAAAPDATAASPRYTDLVLSDSADGAAKSVFNPQTPKLFLRGKLADVPNGSKLKGDWIAEKTKVAPPNYRIDGTELKVGPLINTVRFSMTKPTAGWPEGDYRVDLFIDGKAATQVKFKVVK